MLALTKLCNAISFYYLKANEAVCFLTVCDLLWCNAEERNSSLILHWWTVIYIDQYPQQLSAQRWSYFLIFVWCKEGERPPSIWCFFRPISQQWEWVLATKCATKCYSKQCWSFVMLRGGRFGKTLKTSMKWITWLTGIRKSLPFFFSHQSTLCK